MKFKSIVQIACFTLALFSFNTHANLLTNGDFETGDLSGWTAFTESNGIISESVALFDTTGTGSSLSAGFNVGQLSYTSGVFTGGGITQSFTSETGLFDFSLDIAALGGCCSTNVDGGLFSLLVDNIVVDFFNFGQITTGAIERSSLFASLNLSGGLHELSILMQRPWVTNSTTPNQFLDNVEVNQVVSAVPVPAAAWLFGSALLGFFGFSRRKNQA